MIYPPNPRAFLIDVPNLHPLSVDYVSFWREQKRRCIEGYWVGGYYMPPALYFYVNFATIKLNKAWSNIKTYERPWLRDLEWLFFWHFTEAFGFSGFADDPDITCFGKLDKLPKEYLPASCFRADGTIKKYESPTTYLRRQHPHHYKEPEYLNDMSNILMLGARNTGKSYMVGAGLVPWMFLFDGATRYTQETIDNPLAVEILVGAGDSSKSKDLLKKTQDAFDLLPGQTEISSRHYPSPFAKRTTGSWTINSDIKASYKKKFEGAWKSQGSGAVIKHRSFNANPFAAQGTRPNLLVLEEAGLLEDLKEIFDHTVDCLRDGLRKTGILMMLGTGGDMDKGTIPASEMFYQPEKYNILHTPDIYEHRGNIGFFIPAYLSLNEFKDTVTGYTREKDAQDALDYERDKAKGTSRLHSLIQYKPNVPSEMFLTKSANMFPIPELRNRLTEVVNHKLYEYSEKKAVLHFDPNAPHGVSMQVDPTLQAISTFPYTEDNREGCVVIYEQPILVDGRVPEGAYIIGHDPFKDDTETGQSLATVYVMKSNKHFATVGHNEIVASYIGRPYMGKDAVNEIMYKLSLYYGNAKIYFENAVGNVKDYFEKIRRLDLIATKPITVFNQKAVRATSFVPIYGYPMSNDKIKFQAMQYLRTWLLDDRGDNKRNLDLITDIGLLQELIAFNMDGNFDRVMGLAGCIIGLEETTNLDKRRQRDEQYTNSVRKDFDRFIVNNSFIFHARPSQTTYILQEESGKRLSVGEGYY